MVINTLSQSATTFVGRFIWLFPILIFHYVTIYHSVKYNFYRTRWEFNGFLIKKTNHRHNNVKPCCVRRKTRLYLITTVLPFKPNAVEIDGDTYPSLLTAHASAYPCWLARYAAVRLREWCCPYSDESISGLLWHPPEETVCYSKLIHNVLGTWITVIRSCFASWYTCGG